jgi:hypothetical protein
MHWPGGQRSVPFELFTSQAYCRGIHVVEERLERLSTSGQAGAGEGRCQGGLTGPNGACNFLGDQLKHRLELTAICREDDREVGKVIACHSRSPLCLWHVTLANQFTCEQLRDVPMDGRRGQSEQFGKLGDGPGPAVDGIEEELLGAIIELAILGNSCPGITPAGQGGTCTRELECAGIPGLRGRQLGHTASLHVGTSQR